ncbi:hypothetical protein COJ07_30765 [Bacillus cereus]|nr:hypothetical protein COJ07_30765 [Bacillus cereus]
MEQIENYWHEHRIKNRNEAMRQPVEKEFKSYIMSTLFIFSKKPENMCKACIYLYMRFYNE